MSSVNSSATVALSSIATDLAIHIYNYGIPMPTSLAYMRSEAGLAFTGTASGIVATSVSGGLYSGELNSMVAGLKSDYDKKLAKVVIASSVVSTKVLSQVGVVLAQSLVLGNGSSQIGSWSMKQLMPTLFVHAVLAGTIPYFM
jgi:TRAP-type mannitol/chloroaromatic compound transport system permease large subunit